MIVEVRMSSVKTEMAIFKNVMRSLKAESPKSLTPFGLAHKRKYSLGENNEHHEFLKASTIQTHSQHQVSHRHHV
jgi:hypothetical protein